MTDRGVKEGNQENPQGKDPCIHIDKLSNLPLLLRSFLAQELCVMI